MATNRRSFLKDISLTTACFAISKYGFGAHPHFEKDEPVNLTILHTNDVHSRLEPFPLDNGKYAGMGGVAERASIIKQIRAEQEHVLLLDAGDIFQGTPYFNFYNGEPEIKAMTMMGYDAGTLGNHDFDKGMENFATQMQHASFPIINCNYDVTGTELEGKILPYKIINKGKIKIGILGIGIKLDGLVPENLFGKTIYNNPVENANRTAEYLHKQGCDLIVCLSHLGDKYFDNTISDEILAKENYYIDLIIGGHTHRFFEKPRLYKNKRGSDTAVNQVGFAGINLGRLDYNFNIDERKKSHQSHRIEIRGK